MTTTSSTVSSAPKPEPALGLGLSLISLLVTDYDEAIAFFTGILGFTLTEDTPSVSTATGAVKRWVVVHPPQPPSFLPSSSSSPATAVADSGTGASPASGSGCGILLAKADGEAQRAMVGNQWGGRVGLFLRVADFESTYRRMKEAKAVGFVGEPRREPYGWVVVFRDLWGNKWDLLGS